GGALHIGMAQAEFADRGVEGEPVDASAGGVYQHCGRPVYDIARGHLVPSGLQEIRTIDFLAPGRLSPVNAEDRADGNVHINVAAAVEGVEETDILGIAADL